MKERIIEESAKMFAKHGVKSIRMDDIAASLGISKRTIYELFSDKETLIKSSLAHYFQCQGKIQLELIKDAENIIEEILLLVNDLERLWLASHIIMEDIKKFYPAIYQQIVLEREECGYPNLKQKVQTGIDQGVVISDIDVDIATTVFADAIHGIMQRSDHGVRSFGVIKEIKYMFTYFFRGMLTEKGIKIFDEKLKKYSER